MRKRKKEKKTKKGKRDKLFSMGRLQVAVNNFMVFL